MLLQWRRRGGVARLPPRDNPETTLKSSRQAANSSSYGTRLLRRTVFPVSTQSTPSDERPQTAVSAPQGGCQFSAERSATGDAGAPSSTKIHFVSRLLPPARCRRRQSRGVQRENCIRGPKSVSVPVYSPSSNVESVAGEARLCSPVCCGKDLTHEGEASSCSVKVQEVSKKTNHLRTLGSLPARATTAGTAAARATKASLLKIVRVTAATATGTARSCDASQMQGSEGAPDTRKTQEVKCQPQGRQHMLVTQRYLEAAAASRCGERAQSDKRPPVVQRSFCGKNVRERFSRESAPARERPSLSVANASVQTIRKHSRLGQPAMISPTNRRPPSSAVASSGTTTRRKVVRGTMQKNIIKQLSCDPETVNDKEDSSLPTQCALPFARRVASVKSSVARCHSSTRAQEETKTRSEGKKGAERRSSFSVRFANVFLKEDARRKDEKKMPLGSTCCGVSPESMTGFQRQEKPIVTTKWQKGCDPMLSPSGESSIRSRVEVGNRKVQSVLQQRRQGIVKMECLQASQSRSLPCTLGGDRLNTLWSVGGLSDTLIVRRGLAAVLLMDTVGSVALLRRALTTPREWQRYLQHTSHADCSDHDDVKALMELPAKVRSKNVILNLLQGVVTLQQVLPVDVTQAQADLRVLSLQQLLVLRLKNTHEYQLSSSYHSCHASFLHVLDCHIAEHLGAYLVNEAYFELFMPLVQEQKQQQLRVTPTHCGEEEGGGLSCTGSMQERTKTHDDDHVTLYEHSTTSFSGASTRSSSPQNGIVRGRLEAAEDSAWKGDEGDNHIAERQQQVIISADTKKAELCTGHPGSAAGGAANTNKETRAEERTLRESGIEGSAGSHSPKIAATSRNICPKLEGGQYTEALIIPELHKCVWSGISEAATFASVGQTRTEGSTDKGESGKPKYKQEEQHPPADTHAVASPVDNVEWTKKGIIISGHEKAISGYAKRDSKNPHAALVEKEARFLVEDAAQKGLLGVYSPSSFDLPAGEAAAGRAQLRALGAAFVRQLGVIVSAAGKKEGGSSKKKVNNISDSISAADLEVLQHVQKYVLHEDSAMELEAEPNCLQSSSEDDAYRTDACSRQAESPVHAPKDGGVVERLLNTELRNNASAAPGTRITARPAGVWIRLLVPCRNAAAGKMGGTTVNSVSSTSGESSSEAVPRSAVPGTVTKNAEGKKATILTHPNEAGKEHPRARRKSQDGVKWGDGGGPAARLFQSRPTRETLAAAGQQMVIRELNIEEDRDIQTAVKGNVPAGTVRSGLRTSSIVVDAARASVAAAAAATRLRKAAAGPLAMKQSEKQAVQEKQGKNGWMEAFLWLRVPSYSEEPVVCVRSNTGAPAVCEKSNTDEAAVPSTLGQEQHHQQLLQQTRDCRAVQPESASHVKSKSRNRGMFELVVSNDRPVGEVLLWGMAPQNNQMLCSGTRAGSWSGGSLSSTRAKWTVVVIPRTAVLQQHLGHETKVTDVVSELKETLSMRCRAMNRAVEREGGTAVIAAS